jgi:hypothetical protein
VRCPCPGDWLYTDNNAAEERLVKFGRAVVVARQNPVDFNGAVVSTDIPLGDLTLEWNITFKEAQLTPQPTTRNVVPELFRYIGPTTLAIPSGDFSLLATGEGLINGAYKQYLIRFLSEQGDEVEGTLIVDFQAGGNTFVATEVYGIDRIPPEAVEITLDDYVAIYSSVALEPPAKKTPVEAPISTTGHDIAREMIRAVWKAVLDPTIKAAVAEDFARQNNLPSPVVGSQPEEPKTESKHDGTPVQLAKRPDTLQCGKDVIEFPLKLNYHQGLGDDESWDEVDESRDLLDCGDDVSTLVGSTTESEDLVSRHSVILPDGRSALRVSCDCPPGTRKHRH